MAMKSLSCRGRRIRRIVLSVSGLLAHLSIGETAWAQTDTANPILQGPGEAEVRCLTLAIAYEAGHEPRTGKEAVAEVVLNRTQHPAYPKNVCDVVFQGSQRRTGCQFTFTCDGAMRRRLPARILDDARKIALKALNGELPTHVDGAINYHANYVMPRWASSLYRVTRIGAHIFYRLPDSQFAGYDRSALARQWSGPDDPGIDAAVLAAAVPSARVSPSQRTVSARPPITFAPWGIGLSE